MAVLDPRLLDLIETLSAARMDWLVFELVEGLQAGRTFEEAEESLAEVRRAVSGKDQPKARSEPKMMTAQAVAIEGDDQIVWAAAYVANRLDSALTQAEEAVDTLDQIVGGGDANAGVAQTIVDDGPIVVLSDGEFPRAARRDDVRDARAILPSLRVGLEAWSARMRDGIQT